MKKLLLLILLVFSFSRSQAQCPPITQMSYSGYTGTSVVIEWNAVGTPTFWEIEYGIHGFTQGTGVLVTMFNTPFTIAGLSTNTTYDVYIRSVCNQNQVSAFTGPLIVPGNYNTITGRLTFDQNSNGCTASDPLASGISVTASSTTSTAQYFGISDSNGDYTILVPDGTYNLTVIVNNSIISVHPTTINISFPNATTSLNQNFCLPAAAMQEDMSVVIIPETQARPGFRAAYTVVLTNQGTVPVSDVVDFTYPSDYMTFLTAMPVATSSTSTSLSWNYTLHPFESATYRVEFNLNAPTHPTFPLNSGDILNLNASTYLTGADIDISNNTAPLAQSVVNSFDPNDKTCLQGKNIDPSQVGEYLDYLIRFENTGTASAINVRIKDVIDTSKFDISSLVPLNASHEYYTSITNGNEVAFHFDNINLDFNDATNDGYVLFKVRTQSALVDGDSFDNTAQIYFDFNFPIITNTETVTIMSTAGTMDTLDKSIKFYPNPASDFMSISSANLLQNAAIVDMSGRIVSQISFTGNSREQRVSLSNLSSGIYFVTINSERGQKIEKLVVD